MTKVSAKLTSSGLLWVTVYDGSSPIVSRFINPYPVPQQLKGVKK